MGHVKWSGEIKDDETEPIKLLNKKISKDKAGKQEDLVEDILKQEDLVEDMIWCREDLEDLLGSW